MEVLNDHITEGCLVNQPPDSDSRRNRRQRRLKKKPPIWKRRQDHSMGDPSDDGDRNDFELNSLVLERKKKQAQKDIDSLPFLFDKIRYDSYAAEHELRVAGFKSEMTELALLDKKKMSDEEEIKNRKKKQLADSYYVYSTSFFDGEREFTVKDKQMNESSFIWVIILTVMPLLLLIFEFRIFNIGIIMVAVFGTCIIYKFNHRKISLRATLVMYDKVKLVDKVCDTRTVHQKRGPYTDGPYTLKKFKYIEYQHQSGKDDVVSGWFIPSLVIQLCDPAVTGLLDEHSVVMSNIKLFLRSFTYLNIDSEDLALNPTLYNSVLVALHLIRYNRRKSGVSDLKLWKSF